MIVRQFLLWARQAQPGDRAEAVGALARAYLHSELSPDDRREAATALTAMLDDPSTLVRRTMAENLASSPDVPRHLVLALLSDSAEIAELLLERSPVLADCDLVDALALGDERAHRAVASRPWLSAAASAALAEIGSPTALVLLARNPGAEIADGSLARMVERHGAAAELREALLDRDDVPVEICQAITVALSDALAAFVTECGWLSPQRTERALREARERTTVTLSGAAEKRDAQRLVAHLRSSGQLTPGLILRALLSCGMTFVEAALSELSGLAPKRVAAILHDRRGGAFGPLYTRSRLPESLRPAFEAALSAWRENKSAGLVGSARMSRRMVERALSACEAMPSDETDRLLALLRRFEAEIARDEARDLADTLADDAALTLVRRHVPDALLEAPRALAA